ncbi:MAG: tRNA 2-thiocytidine(32) synthetase TtcA, partial [Burkholderiaceae bacterium]
LVSDDGKHVVIRPLAYVKEADTERYAELRQFPIIPCDLCGSQENLQRKQIKGLMREWEKKFPGRVDNIFAALSTVAPSHLMDKKLFDFASLTPTGVADANGDIAFDDEPCAPPTANVVRFDGLMD